MSRVRRRELPRRQPRCCPRRERAAPARDLRLRPARRRRSATRRPATALALARLARARARRASTTDSPRHPLMARLRPDGSQLRASRASRSQRLIEANRLDQHRDRYETFDELRGLLRPVGRPGRRARAARLRRRHARAASRSRTASAPALQLTEHCQDVAEDLARGRVYLPQEDLERFGCAPSRPARRRPAPERVRALDGASRSRAPASSSSRARRSSRTLRVAGRGSPSPASSPAAASALGAIERAGYDVLRRCARDASQRAARAREPPRGAWRRAAGRCQRGSRLPRAARRSRAAEAANFFYGIRLLPPDKRRAMCAVYAFARRVDDIGDGDLPPDEKLRLARAERARLDGSTSGAPTTQSLIALARRA